MQADREGSEQDKKVIDKKVLELLMGIALLLFVGLIAGNESVMSVISDKVEKREKKVIVIDAGHGGFDPGKVGVNQTLEKDINLSIALKLKKLLEAEDIEVIMTREDEHGLYDENTANKKVQDMKRRCEIIDKSNPEFTVSIHQNSYHEEAIRGAQVFYYEQSQEGKRIAECIQEELKKVDLGNRRAAKSNNSYYLLKKTEKPTLIVECGFLSNWEEAEKLNTEEYQDKMVWAIHMAVMKCLNERKQ